MPYLGNRETSEKLEIQNFSIVVDIVNDVKSIDGSDNFIAQCKSKLGIDVTQDKMLTRLILVGKKHYIGIPCDLTKELPSKEWKE